MTTKVSLKSPQKEAFTSAALIYLVKTIPLCRGMAWMPFQKCQQAKRAFLEKGQYVYSSILSSKLNKKFLFLIYTNFALGQKSGPNEP